MSSTNTTSTIVCSGIPLTTSDEKVKEFFTFCGKVNSITTVTKTEKTQTVEVVFENPSAVSTALLLNGAELNGSKISVTAGSSSATAPAVTPSTAKPVPTSSDIRQEDKPKSTIVAEILANGYVLGDDLIQKAIDFDKKHGISTRFKTFITNLENKYHIQAKQQELTKEARDQWKLDEKYEHGKRTFDSYVDSFKQGKIGSKVHSFYKDTSKEVKEVHEEARRIANEKEAAKAAAAPAAPTASATSATSTSTLSSDPPASAPSAFTTTGTTPSKGVQDTTAPAAPAAPEAVETQGKVSLNSIAPESTTAKAAASIPVEDDSDLAAKTKALNL